MRLITNATNLCCRIMTIPAPLPPPLPSAPSATPALPPLCLLFLDPREEHSLALPSRELRSTSASVPHVGINRSINCERDWEKEARHASLIRLSFAPSLTTLQSLNWQRSRSRSLHSAQQKWGARRKTPRNSKDKVGVVDLPVFRPLLLS